MILRAKACIFILSLSCLCTAVTANDADTPAQGNIVKTDSTVVRSAAPTAASSNSPAPLSARDSMAVADLYAAPAATPPHKTGWQKFKDYFTESNKPKENKAFDFSVIGGPHYSSDTNLGLGVVASGLYRMNRHDTLMPQSNVSLFGDITISGFYVVGIKGDNLFPKDRYRLSYRLYTMSFPSYFWGIGYSENNNDDNKSKYTLKKDEVAATFLFKVAKNLYIGPDASFSYIYAKDIQRYDLFDGEPTSTIDVGLGASIIYDTRDILTAPTRGTYLKLGQRFFPSFLGNKYDFITTEFIADYYQKVWKGAILAFDFYTELNYGDVPWTMLSQLGGSYRMRGYYNGRYRDNDLMCVQMELRQHIWHRHGVVAWVGAGNVFPDFNNFKWNQTLPNYGLGYRWEFKKGVNVRLDYGFGKNGQSGFLFQINEAF